MVDRITKEKRSKIMAAIHSENTKPEMELRRALWAEGLRYRIHYSSEKIDIAFPTKKLAIFIDGCFWHGCPIHSHIPKSNVSYWLPKLNKNIERDKTTSKRLEADGWRVIRFWEHEFGDVSKIAKNVQKELSQK